MKASYRTHFTSDNLDKSSKRYCNTAAFVPNVSLSGAFSQPQHASPTSTGLQIYLGLMAFQLLLAIVLPGFKQIGLPIESLGGRRLMYNCNALGAFYITLITVAGLHYTDVFRLSGLIDHFGPVMTVAIIVSFAISAVCYLGTVLLGRPIRMSGNPIYDFFSM